MPKVILIYANCVNSKAKGDFALAGGLAKDLALLLAEQHSEIKVVLTSTLSGINKYNSLYGKSVNGKITTDGVEIEVTALEVFDSVENNVVAYIEANRCKHAPAELIKQVLSPDSKLVFIGAANKNATIAKDLYVAKVALQQPGLYPFFDQSSIAVYNAGLGDGRIGLTTLSKPANLPKLDEASHQYPNGSYGFMYLNAINPVNEGQTIGQYMQLTHYGQYVLVGNFAEYQFELKTGIASQLGPSYLPKITYHQSLDSSTMRHMVNQSQSVIVSTGVMSTLEAMNENKLPFYQNIDSNSHFVASYLVAIKSVCHNDGALLGKMPELVFQLAELLFAKKPLASKPENELGNLLKMPSVTSKLIDINQAIIAKANGKIAPQLLSFITSDPSPSSSGKHQCVKVCDSLRNPGEISSPVYDQALRRAAAWGRQFELKVLLRNLSKELINRKDTTGFHRSALHWAVIKKNQACASLLIQADADVDSQDNMGKTPLFYALANGEKEMIKLLVCAGASLDIQDHSGKKPCEDVAEELKHFVATCSPQLQNSGTAISVF